MAMAANKRQKRVQLPELEENLIEEILVSLPLKTLIKFRAVSKTWLSLISTPRFAYRIHTLSRSIDKPRASYMVIRNLNYHLDKKFIIPVSVGPTTPRITRKRRNLIGLMGVDVQALCPAGLGIYCGFEYKQGICMLWNPVIRETRVLPTSPFYSACGVNVCHFGITDYDERRNKVSWKVGRVTSKTILTTEHDEILRHQLKLSLELYSSETNSWKFIPNFSMTICLGYDHLATSHYANLNGRVHWLIGYTKYITSFDYEKMVIKKIGVPRFELYDTQKSFVTLFDDKYLCLVLLERTNILLRSVDIWVMLEYGVEDSWTKVCTLGPIIHREVEVLGYSSKAQCVFLRHLHGLPTRLGILDCNSSKIEWFHLPGKPRDHFIKIVEHSESLFSLSVQEKGTRASNMSLT